MNILLLEPFFTGSHRKWAEGYQRCSHHHIEILAMKGKHWKWRMYGGAVSLAIRFGALDFQPGLILATDMLDLTTFLALTRRQTAHLPTAVYFHENQINYPWSPFDEDPKLKRNNQYGFINYTSAVAADGVFFNSQFHRNAFLSSLPAFLRQFPDSRELRNAEMIRQKSGVLPLGMDFSEIPIRQRTDKNNLPVILWNHRWEYDKDPETFFEVLAQLQSEGLAFKLIVLGESFHRSPASFAKAERQFSDEIIHFGFVKDLKKYYRLLHLADILPVTSQQDFFGASTVEAIFCDCYPLLPRRLAYPEHVPSQFHNRHLYHDATELLDKLRSLLQQPGQIRYQPFSDFVSQYDWRILADQYDEAMERIADESNKPEL